MVGGVITPTRCEPPYMTKIIVKNSSVNMQIAYLSSIAHFFCDNPFWVNISLVPNQYRE